MRKLISGTFIVLFMAAGLTSCKKDWTCECTSSVAGMSATASTTIKATKKDAKSACEGQNSSTSVAGVGGTTCTLK